MIGTTEVHLIIDQPDEGGTDAVVQVIRSGNFKILYLEFKQVEYSKESGIEYRDGIYQKKGVIQKELFKETP